ncbi:MAG: cobalamin biosynthesis protein CbiD [Synergistaceae bacterium]|nr:cobalamin biosynthesis protein CbiD [Synergistaceae bacterium]
MCNRQRSTLRTGVTTGTCAAAAAKASALHLISGNSPENVTVKNLEGFEFSLPVFREGNYFGVIKDAGDDKSDVTDGAKILAQVEFSEGEGSISFIAGEGVGTVTLPGLKIPVGQPAINPVPREMIKRSVREVIPKRSVKITIAVPDGKTLAERTFNPRLGIAGGISILGTTGIVKPMNEKALLDSLTLELGMIHSLGFSELYIAFAGTGEKFTRKIFGLEGRNVIQCGNYIGHVLDEAANLGFTRSVICGSPGKLLKVSAGSFNTHSRNADGRLEALCTHLALTGAGRELIRRVYESNTTNEAVEIVRAGGFAGVWNNIAEVISQKCAERVNGAMKIDVVFFDGEGVILGEYYGA